MHSATSLQWYILFQSKVMAISTSRVKQASSKVPCPPFLSPQDPVLLFPVGRGHFSPVLQGTATHTRQHSV